MIISVWNMKGGVGKTHLSLALAKDLNLKYYTNENNFLEDTTLLKDDTKIADAAIFDFGGFVDKIANYLKISDLIIVPTTRDKLALLKTYETLKIIESINKNIIIVVTKNKNHFQDETFKMLEKINKNQYKTFLLNESNIFQKSLEENVSVWQLSCNFAYKNKAITMQYKELLDFFN